MTIGFVIHGELLSSVRLLGESDFWCFVRGGFLEREWYGGGKR